MKKIMMILFSAIFAAGIFAGCSGGTTNDAKDTAESGAGQTETAQELMSASYVDIMKTGKYLMHFKTTVTSDNQAFTSEVTQAIDGSNMSMVTNSGDMAIHMIKKDKTVYVLNEEAKTYYKIDIDDTNASGTTASLEDQVIDTTGITYAGKGRAELNGKEMDYEEYIMDQGTLRYYFEDGKLYAIVFKSADLESVMEIIEFSDKVTSDMFEIPVGYTEATTY